MSELEDRLAIRDLVENWAVWRDAGDWERFRSVWHDDGVMMATWFQGPADEFIRVTREGWARGVSILHFLGGTSIDLAGNRAIAQTKMTISQRGDVHGVLCDVVCTGRFYDFLEKRDGRWGLVLRQPIYEKDRIDPVDPSARLAIDQSKLARVSARLPPPRVHSDADRLHGQARHAADHRTRSRRAVRARQGMARRPVRDAVKAHRGFAQKRSRVDLISARPGLRIVISRLTLMAETKGIERLLTPEQLIADFFLDIERWRNENSSS